MTSELVSGDESQGASSLPSNVPRFAGVLMIAGAALPSWFHRDVALLSFIAVALLASGVSIVLTSASLEATAWEKLILCGPVFFAMPMGVFGSDHFLDFASINRLIPKWVPAHTFITYFVGACLVAASLSIIFRKMAGLAAALTGVLFLFFEAFMHIPIAATLPRQRIAWMVMARDFCFCSGALSLAATHTAKWRLHGTHWLVSAARVCIGSFILLYGLQYFVHPELLPGVPLRQLTPAFIPEHLFWGYLTAVVYVVGGLFLLGNRKKSLAAMCLGFFIFCTVLIFSVPFMIQHGGVAGLNVPLDNLMFSGALFCLSASFTGKSDSPKSEAVQRPTAVVAVAL